MLLVVVWSPLVLWLNARTRVVHSRGGLDDPTGEIMYDAYFEWGCPWSYAGVSLYGNEAIEPPPLRPEYIFSYSFLAANTSIGVLAVAVLTLVSKYLLRRAGFWRKPPETQS